MDLHGAAAIAAQTIRSRRRWFLAADSDADGLTAAAVMATALARAGIGFQVRNSRQKDEAAYLALESMACDGYVLLDKGSSHLDVLAELGRRTGRLVVVVDHHGLPDKIPEGITLVNPRNLGMDGSRDACAATTAFAVALALDPRNLDLAGIALAGAVGDWQHRGGWQGWNKQIIDQALAAGHLEERHGPALIGTDLVDALTHTDPPTPGMVGDHDAARAFLETLGMEGVRDVEELAPDAQSRLLSAWTLHHLQHGSPPDVVDRLTRRALWDRRTGTGVRHLFRLMDACGRTGQAAVGLGFMLGDKAAEPDVREAFADYAGRLHAAVQRLRMEGSDGLQACQVAWTDDPALTGMVGGIGMTHVLADRHRPAVILAKRPDGDVQVSTRGTHEAVEAGLDLGDAVRSAASTVGRDGGGHPVASGTVIASADVDAFLAALDASLVAQSFLP